MPELWLGIDVKTLPYLKALRDDLIRQSDTIDVSQLGIGSDITAPITDEAYVQLYLHRLNPIAAAMGGTKKTQLLEEFPVQQVLKRPDRLILITGDAGSGKTTSLRRLALLLVQDALASKEATEIPIFLRATNVVRSSSRLVDVAILTAEKLIAASAHCFSRKDLEEGHLAILIDGYDELAAENDRDLLVRRMREFIESFPRCRLILTSRDYSFARKLPEQLPFTRYNISPINLQQTEKMVARLSHGKALAPDAAQEMLRRLSNIHGMELNPLLVTVFIATSDYSRQDIPANITELFKKFTEMMLGRWDSSKGLAQQYHAPLKDFLLCRLAFQMHSGRDSSWSVKNCRELLQRELVDRGHEADIDVLLEEVFDRSGLLVIQDDNVRFRHLLIQEFFAGRGIPDADMLHSVIDDLWWTKAVVFHFGEHPDNHKDLNTVIQSVTSMDSSRLFQSAISVGLALQACYLTKLTDKNVILRWVLATLANAKPQLPSMIHQEGDQAKTDEDPPLMDLLVYYMLARDAVAGKAIRGVSDQLFAVPPEGLSEAELEMQHFWCIAGLIESGDMEEAEKRIKHFNPADSRLVMCIHLGSYYAWKMRVLPPDQKKIAEKICDRLAPRINHLHKQLLKELKSILLEVRSGNVKAIDEDSEEAK